jgi:Zn-dependent protease/CBS domain-containing protein
MEFRQQGLNLGRLFGIEVRADWSLLIIFVLILFSLGAGLFPARHPDWGPAAVWLTAGAAAVAFFASVLLHELSHALVGRANGIEVRRITLFMFGGMAHMENEPPSWRAELAMSLVGPLTSLALGFLFLGLARLVAGPLELDPEDPGRFFAGLGPVASLLFWLGPINILLAVFNLVPGFPLDGGRVLRAALWGATGDLLRATRWASAGGQFFAWVLIASGFLMLLGIPVPFFGRGLVGGLWLMLIGWFLNNAAQLSYRQLLVKRWLGDLPVSRLMWTGPERLAPELTVRAVADDYLRPGAERTHLVEEDEKLLGLVSLGDLLRVPRERWDFTPIERIMTPAARLVTVPPETNAVDALELLGRHNLNQLPVVERGRAVGLVRREDILRWLVLHAESDASRGKDSILAMSLHRRD